MKTLTLSQYLKAAHQAQVSSGHSQVSKKMTEVGTSGDLEDSPQEFSLEIIQLRC